jgi:glucose-1-phosphate adenylyltransferase
MKTTLSMILAGGKGKRLMPLTNSRAKPSVSFAGKYKIIDFAITPHLRAGINKILVLTQYETRSLEQHIQEGLIPLTGISQSIRAISPREKISGKKWYKGTADAVYHNIDEIQKISPEEVSIFAGDHIYALDFSKMLNSHNSRKRDLTISIKPRVIKKEDFEIGEDKKKHYKYGLIQTEKNGKIKEFKEKPLVSEMPKIGETALISMGNYIFETSILINFLKKRNPNEVDFGKNIIPKMIKKNMKIYSYIHNNYWRDVGDLDAYWEANINLNDPCPKLNLNELWKNQTPILTSKSEIPPTTYKDKGKINTICEGSIIEGIIERCVISSEVKIEKRSSIKNSIIFSRNHIGKGVTIQNTIIDKDNYLSDGTTIGYDLKKDKKRGFTVTKKGVVTIPKNFLKK